MSYILDALKKTEREKARKDRQQGSMTGIAGELFRDEPAGDPPGIRVAVIVPVVLVVVLATAAVTWYLLRGSSSPTKAPPPPQRTIPVQAAAPPAPVATLPAPPVPAETSLNRAQSAPAAPERAASQPKPAAPLQREREANSGPDQAGPHAVAVPARNTTAATQAVAPPAAQLAAPPVDIKVSGIAWQDERPARRAVINGLLLREGNTVAGARVIEIQQDRVRFSLSGRTFDVPLLAAGVPSQRQQ